LDANVRYFSGYTGESASMLVSGDAACLVTDSRYIELAQNDLPSFIEAQLPKKGAFEELRKRLPKKGAFRIGFESSMSYGVYQRFQKVFEGCELVANDKIPQQIRMVKTADEIRKSEKAMKIACKSMWETVHEIGQDATELDLVAEYEYRVRRHGAAGVGFESIIAAGPNAAIPHAKPGNRRVRDSEMLLVDFGALCDGYRSDLTRVFFFHRIAARAKRIYSIVLEAQKLAIESIAPGVSGADIDAAARNHLRKHRLASKFGHGLGHGVGLQIHEAPGLSAKSTDIMKSGMVVTVEPGLYFPGWGGVRIEDMVVVTRNGHRVIESLPKELDEVIIE